MLFDVESAVGGRLFYTVFHHVPTPAPLLKRSGVTLPSLGLLAGDGQSLAF